MYEIIYKIGTGSKAHLSESSSPICCDDPRHGQSLHVSQDQTGVHLP